MKPTDRRHGTPHHGTGDRERGSALVLALLVMIIMTLLGLAFVVAGQTETQIALNSRDAEQALFVAEGGVRAVKNWFDMPSGSGSFLVPTISQMDRTQRWVDDDLDGTFEPYSSATPPFNVVYRQGTDDPFDRPLRGAPSRMLIGNEDHPDVRIAENGSTAERTYLATLNASMYPNLPSGLRTVRITQIDVYSPPIFTVGGSRTRFGIATIKVTAGVFERVEGVERQVASRAVKAVLNEAPYPGPMGPLQSNVNIDVNGDFGAHWGTVTSTVNMTLPSNLDIKIASGVPWHSRTRIIARDMNLDGALELGVSGVGTPDDQDGDGTLDFDEWIASDNTEDPWLRFWSEADIFAGVSPVTPGCSSPDCQPSPFYQAGLFGTGSTDHSGIFKNVTYPTFPNFEYDLYKSFAQGGGQNVFYYASDGPGTGTYRLNGEGPPLTYREATEGQKGLFFFDTATNTAPYDAAYDGTYDNLADEIQLSGGGYSVAGFVYLNANFRTTGNGNAPARTVMAPGEPYIDTNSNRRYDPEEYFVDLTYPSTIDGTYAKHGMRREIDGFTRQVPHAEAGPTGHYQVGVNFYGVVYTNGTYDAGGNWVYYGSVVTKSGMYVNGATGTPQIYFDERILEDWPPPDAGLPRTIITAWEATN